MASPRTDVKPTKTDGSRTATGRPPVGRGAAQDRRLLARVQLPRRRHDLPARQPAAARAAQGRARQAAPARPLGRQPGPGFAYIHLNRLINKYDLDAIFMAGPGHGAPGVLGAVLPRRHVLGDLSRTRARTRRACCEFFKEFSFPGGIGSHCTPETPGSIHEGGELGYVLSHACGAAFDNPDLIVAAVVGDGEAETGPLATSWHSTSSSTRSATARCCRSCTSTATRSTTRRCSRASATKRSRTSSRATAGRRTSSKAPTRRSMHQAMAATMEQCVQEIRARPEGGARSGKPTRPRWPMIVLRTPKGWTGPEEVDGHKVEGFWRSHQVPMAGVHEQSRASEAARRMDAQLQARGTVRRRAAGSIAGAEGARAHGHAAHGANPHANGGLLRKALRMPDFRDYAHQGRQARHGRGREHPPARRVPPRRHEGRT